MHTPTIEPFDLRNTKILSYSSHLRNTDKISFDYLTYRQHTPSKPHSHTHSHMVSIIKKTRIRWYFPCSQIDSRKHCRHLHPCKKTGPSIAKKKTKLSLNKSKMKTPGATRSHRAKENNCKTI